MLDLIISVEDVLDSSKPPLHTKRVLFPRNTDDISARLRKTNLAITAPSQVSIGNPYQCLKVLLALHDAILHRISQPAAKMLGPVYRRDLSLYLGSFLRLWKLFLRLQETPEQQINQHDLAYPLLTIVQEVHSLVMSMKQKISLDQRSSLLLAQCVADLIGTEWLRLDLQTQMSISKPLSTILTVSQIDLQLKKAFDAIVLPVLSNIKAQNHIYVTELQVCHSNPEMNYIHANYIF